MVQDQDLIAIQEARTRVEQAWTAAQKYRTYSQEQVDAIVERMAAAARAKARELAEMAVRETGYGNVKDKIAKNLLCADLLPRKMRGMKTVGVLREIPEEKVVEMGVPVGVVAAVLPTTNPTSTAIYKTLIALKAGNAIVHSPHPRAKGCTCATVDLLYRAALEAGAPEHIIGCVTNATLESTQALMQHRRTGVILSTGGSGIVRAAYSSGKPAFGVGPGNVPVLAEKSADISEVVAKVVDGKSFDYGTVCSSEQTLIAERSMRDRILTELKARKAFLCDKQQTQALAKLLVTPSFGINPNCVGQAPGKIAEMAGFQVPGDTSILVVEIDGVGREHPLSAEKLSPVLSLLFVDDFEAGLKASEAVLRFGGLGHTCVIFSQDDARIREYAMRMPAFRILVNTPAPQGSTGITTNVFPSMTLGCGAIAGNITSDNIGPQHLINIKRLAYAVRKPEEAFTIPSEAVTAAVATGSGGGRVDRQTVVAAVERYLSRRGISVGSSVVASPSAAVVDRFLLSKVKPSPVAEGCGCATTIDAPAQPASPPVPPVEIVDFVCESDVREAVRQSRKIYIGAKTIVTPAAREAAGAHDVLVQAQR
jgi:acetaldehyde dehydrogenase (acetylating)